MALVKFGQLTLNVENVPDGHMIVSEAEFQSMKQAANSLFSLKSKIPVGVDESQLGVLLEKGQKHDTIAQELTNTQKNVTSLTEQVKKFSNIPQDFSVERWEADRKTERQNIHSAKLGELKKQVFAKVEEKFKVKPNVDDRFLGDLSTFDVDAKDAVDKLYDIYDKADTAQKEFVKNTIKQNTISPSEVGAHQVIADGRATARVDIIGDGANPIVAHI